MKIFSLFIPLISSQYYGGGVGGGFRPNQRNAFIPENGAMRKVSMNEHHGKLSSYIKNDNPVRLSITMVLLLSLCSNCILYT